MNLLSPLDIPEGKAGDWSIKHRTAPAGHVFNTANERGRFFGQKNRQVSWPHETRWTTLLENGSVWMSDRPIEHAQMLACCRGLTGDVLVGGLGLGLAVTILAKRQAVRSVTVVERSPDVIALVEPHLLNHKHTRQRDRDKITVVRAELFNFLKTWDGPRKFTSALYDIWQGDNEATLFNTVVPLLEISTEIVKGRPSCWNEDIMRGQLLTSLTFRLPGIVAERHAGEDYSERPAPWDHQEDIWLDWQAPFWAWWLKAGEPEGQLFADASSAYCRLWGEPKWERRWQELIQHTGVRS